MTSIFMLSCDRDGPEDPEPVRPLPPGTSAIEASPQPTSGDAERGYEYLITGDYVGSGIPYDVYTNLFRDEENILQRSGDNAIIPPEFTAFDAQNGVRVVGGLNCLGCHASTLNGEYIVGLGDSYADFTNDMTGSSELLRSFVIAVHGEDSPEYEAFEPFYLGTRRISPYSVTPFVGLNPAFRIEEAAVSQRDPQDMTWLDEPTFTPPEQGYFSDVPPLWNVDKKNALYYNGMGRGDFTRLLQQAMVVGVTDEDQADEINSNFDDILAWIQELDAPAYPFAVDEVSALSGKSVYEFHCSSCHGTSDDYPNLLVHMDEIGTDAAYARYFIEEPDFLSWIDASWIGETSLYDDYRSAELGYVAPPLDGIWATAPYLHNGSVPTLAALLQSSTRPDYWSRDFSARDYDQDAVGWVHTIEAAPGSTDIYNTAILGYSNQGHTYGDGLSEQDRSDLLEYLKTL